MMKARLAWFYGWAPESLNQMDLQEGYSYYEAITQIEAQQTLLELRIQDWPFMKKESRNRWHRKLHRKAYPRTHQKPVSVEQLADIIRRQVR